MSSSVQVEALPRSEQRRRAIMRATLRVVAEGGLDRVTHRRVAAAAGVPLGSTTYYFASRDDLIRQSFQLYLDESTKVLGDLAREYPEITVENLARGTSTRVRYYDLQVNPEIEDRIFSSRFLDRGVDPLARSFD